ncbi:R3H and coiled-coil domain-containing protein 1 [Gallus gallus]|uniref:R3H domain and coiled-coil containing 1 n=2 Tax=Gallus gallus TaxID=9031 RepID=A0A8V0ZIZ7_CHICK|nr:R3H and coiled-coil domain-containing protein 1 [Gallus gallus]XP_040545317.2 R3H and coiled-coil domain-containing protein 1 [Gallus gallus]
MDGVFLSPNEDEFVGRIAEELEHFMLQGQHHRVLLFPPLSSRLRYLIHRTVENVDLLSSFSVGEGWRRRTVICHSAVRIPSETSEQNPATTAPRPPRPTQPWGRGARGARLRHGGDGHGDTSRACVGSGRIKRPPRRKPDKALYVPKAMRKKVEWGEQEVGADGAREGEICPKAALEGEAEGGPGPNGAIGGVCLVLDEQHKDGEESGKSSHGTNGDRPPRCTDVPPLESSNSSSGQHSQDKDCSDSLSSVPNENPAEPEEQSKSCDDTVGPEGSKTPCQDQKSRDADSKSSHLLGEHCSDATLVLENPKKSCAMSLESSGNVSVQGEDVVSPVLELGEGPSAPESEDQESFSSAREEPTQQQTPLEARGEAVLAPEPIGGAGPSGRSEQEEHREDVPVAKDGVREPMGLADALQRELRLPKGDQEENAATQSRELAFEDDCTAELLQEIMGHLTVKDISVERITLDYSSYGDAQVHEGDFGHVTEIYDFSPSLKTEHLMEVFSDFHESGFKIQWVDDTHALGIFSSLSAASQALGRRYPSLKIRPLIHATKQSKIKALQRPKLLQLAKERPQTDTVVARRLVTRALGLKHQQQCGSGPEGLLPEGLDQEE